MQKNSTYYSWIWDSIDASFVFYIPPTHTILTDSEVEELLAKMVDFHKQYDLLSKKFKIGEIFTEEFLKFKETTMEEFYFGKLEELIFFNNLTFFPFSFNVIEQSEADTMFASKLYHHNDQSQIIDEYVYGMYSGEKATGFCNFESWKRERELPDNILDFTFHSFDNIGDFFTHPISFNISILSNIFYPYLETAFMKDSSLKDIVIDNREIAYLNAPRFNSFLRDLKNLFHNKYGWEFNFEADKYTIERLKYLSEDGIMIDGEIIYQEDLGQVLIN